MAETTRELDQIQNDIETLHERSQNNRANISAHEAVCEERHGQILAMMGSMRAEIGSMHVKVNEVTELASQGRTSLKTLMWVGGVTAGLITVVSVLLNILPK